MSHEARAVKRISRTAFDCTGVRGARRTSARTARAAISTRNVSWTTWLAGVRAVQEADGPEHLQCHALPHHRRPAARPAGRASEAAHHHHRRGVRFAGLPLEGRAMARGRRAADIRMEGSAAAGGAVSQPVDPCVDRLRTRASRRQARTIRRFGAGRHRRRRRAVLPSRTRQTRVVANDSITVPERRDPLRHHDGGIFQQIRAAPSSTGSGISAPRWSYPNDPSQTCSGRSTTGRRN